MTPPLDPGIDEQFMFYPTRAQMDPGSIWLRNIMLGIGRETRTQAEGKQLHQRSARRAIARALAHPAAGLLLAITFFTAGRSDMRFK